MTKHTPGEWRANDTTVFQNNPLGSVVIIASCGSPALKHEERQAIARLIAAAPDRDCWEELRDCLRTTPILGGAEWLISWSQSSQDSIRAARPV